MDVGGGEELGEPRLGLHVDEPHVPQARGLLLERRSGRAAPVDHEHHRGVVDERRRGGQHQVERLREAHVAGVHHHRLALEALLAPVVVLAVARLDPLGVDEVGDDADLGGVTAGAARDLRGHVVAQVVGQHRDRVGRLVGGPLEPRRHRDHPLVGEHAELHGHVGEDVLDVEHERHAARPRHRQARGPQGEGRRHGQHGLGPAPAHHPGEGGEAGEAHEPDGPGRDVALVGGERVDAGEAAPRGVGVVDDLPGPVGLDAVVLVPGQRRDHVEAVAPRREALDDAGHHLARGCHVGCVVGAEHQQPHDAASCFSVGAPATLRVSCGGGTADRGVSPSASR